MRHQSNIRFFCTLIILLTLSSAWCHENKPLVLITTSYNNQKWAYANLTSLFNQSYTNWRLIYVDDNSEDATVEIVKDLIKEYQMEDKVTLIQNKRRRRHLANQYNAIQSCAPQEIAVILDGDDWFMDTQALAQINAVYNSGDVWLTWGQYWYLGKDRIGICKPIPQEILKNGTVREFTPWVISHVRTFYAGLFQQIKYEDLQYHGEFYPMCADVVTMFAMIEMAGDRVHFIPDILYMYNDTNSLCFYHEHVEKQRALEKEIRGKTPYKRLEKAPF